MNPRPPMVADARDLPLGLQSVGNRNKKQNASDLHTVSRRLRDTRKRVRPLSAVTMIRCRQERCQFKER